MAEPNLDRLPLSKPALFYVGVKGLLLGDILNTAIGRGRGIPSPRTIAEIEKLYQNLVEIPPEARDHLRTEN